MLFAVVPTLFAVSIMPGLCMTLALAMGMTIGVKRTLWMMMGELAGLASVATLSIVSVAAVIIAYPSLYLTAKYLGGGYLIYVGVGLWVTGQGLASEDLDYRIGRTTPRSLALQGFVVAVANPKAWIFYASLLPPFIVPSLPFVPQLVTLIVALVVIELISLLVYASGGQALKVLLQETRLLRVVNLLAGSAIVFIGGGLIFLS
jgi:homoserine/homoserine lactone efflux protein